MDFESETLVVVGALPSGGTPRGHGVAGVNDQAVRAGRVIPILEAGARTGTSTDDPRAGIGIGDDDDPMFTLQSGKQHAVALGFDLAQITSKTNRSGVKEIQPTLAEGGRPHVVGGAAVRRLTPRECERLQGIPDGYTDIPNYNPRRTGPFGGNRGVADGPRYKALGNSMAVPVLRWIYGQIRGVVGE